MTAPEADQKREDAPSVLRKTLLVVAVAWTAWRLWRHHSLRSLDGPARLEGLATSKDPEIVASLNRLGERVRLLIT